MGLDMYLRKKHYIGANYPHREVTGEISIKIGNRPVRIDFNKVVEISESAGYWRKANAIHQWFVENVQGGEDDCREYYVSQEQLIELRRLCMQVLETKDATPLPPQSGFFFGSTEIDEYYFQDLKDTIDIINSCLTPNSVRYIEGEEPSDFHEFYYQASW